MKLIVYRPDQVGFSTIEVDLIKKSGKGLGISVITRKSGNGVYIFDVVSRKLKMCFCFLEYIGNSVINSIK